MSQADVDRAVANAASSPAFRQKLREDFDSAVASYDLTTQEKAALKARNLGVEPPAGAKAKKPPPPEVPGGTLGGRPT
jgi:hypothetical protein